MITQKSLDFLKDLGSNNNREWFNENKKHYEKNLKNPFEELVGKLINSFREIEPEIGIEPRQAIFRIYRDTRFSKDKTPYKTHVSAIISKFGRKGKEYPGFYLHLERGVLMLGGGAYFLERESLKKIRRHIALHPKRFASILKEREFVKRYDVLKGEKNKRLDKEFQEALQEQPLIANKQFYYMAEVDPKNILREDVISFVTGYFEVGKPLNEFLAEAIG